MEKFVGRDTFEFFIKIAPLFSKLSFWDFLWP
jgi:hypothetical protein